MAHAFRQLFITHYEKLHRYAFTLLKNEAAASDAVQSVFTRLWEKQGAIILDEGIKNYLYRSIHNHCLNIIRQGNTKEKYTLYQAYNNQKTSFSGEPEEQMVARELQTRIQEAMDSLPAQCKIVFLKSREEGKKYMEIAAEMNISIKTVEGQMGKALKILREKLQEYLVIFIILSWLPY
jgi:RNA polymerase sigma-70 factor, Bacteroides expansion family 1